MTYINEYGEIVRDKDPNDKSQVSLTFFEGLFIFFYNYLFFIPGIILYFNHKNKGYTKKAKQVGIIMGVELVLLFIIIILIVAAS